MRGVWVSPCYPGGPGNSDSEVAVGYVLSLPDHVVFSKSMMVVQVFLLAQRGSCVDRRYSWVPQWVGIGTKCVAVATMGVAERAAPHAIDS